MKYVILLFTSLIFCKDPIYAQSISDICAKQNLTHSLVNKTTTAAAEENDYDVKHLSFNIELTNTSTAVSGYVTTTAKVVATTLPVYAFELSRDLMLDSVKINNILVNSAYIQTTGDVRRVILSTVLPINTIFTAQVYYHGQPLSGTGFFTR